MKINFCIISVLVISLISESSFSAQTRLLTKVSEDIASRYEKIFKNVPKDGIFEIDLMNVKNMKEMLDAKKKAIKSGELNPHKFKREIIKSNISEVKRMKQDFQKRVNNMSAETLDRYADFMVDNAAYSDDMMAYYSAFTRTEKARVIYSALSRDLDDYLSASMKRIGKINKKQLAQDLTRVEREFSTSKFGEKKWQRVLLIAGASIAAAGLATWGIASISYGTKLRRKRNGLEGEYQANVNALRGEYESNLADFRARLNKYSNELQGIRDDLNATQQAELQALINQLENQYSTLNSSLVAEEMSFLQQNGFARTLCNSYQGENTTICNKYGYTLFSGMKTCSVMCYKNSITGQETLHEPPVCTSAYIPSDCFSQSMYDAEYDSAYNTGYNNGYGDGHSDGTDDGTVHGDEDGAADGFDDGYNDGWYFGYDQIYDDAYDDGYDDNYVDLYWTGYNDSYYDRYSEGYNDAYYDRYWDGYDDTFTDRYWEGYDVGWEDGFYDGGGYNSKAPDPPGGTRDKSWEAFMKGKQRGFLDAKMSINIIQTTM